MLNSLRLPLLLSLVLHAALVGGLLPLRPAAAPAAPLTLELLPAPTPQPAAPGPTAAVKATPRPPAPAARPSAAPRGEQARPAAPRAHAPSPAPSPNTAAAGAVAAGADRPAAAPQGEAAAAPAEARDGGQATGGATQGASFRAGSRDNPQPPYPELSRERGESGRVLLRVRVGRGGEALEVSVLQSSGYVRLDRAARETVERWRFTPARRGGEAVEDLVEVPIRFRQLDP